MTPPNIASPIPWVLEIPVYGGLEADEPAARRSKQEPNFPGASPVCHLGKNGHCR